MCIRDRDRISVKDGSRIHLIHLEELLYIQASGDYVALFTTDGQYIDVYKRQFLNIAASSQKLGINLIRVAILIIFCLLYTSRCV